jgi:hypothetical protein
MAWKWVTVRVTGLRHALDGQVAVDRDRLVAVEPDGSRLEADGGIFLGVEEVLGLDVLVEQRQAGIHRFGVDGDVDRSGLRRAVEHDPAAGLVEAMLLEGIAEVVVLEARQGVPGIDGEAFRRGQGGGGKGGQGGDEQGFLHGFLLGRLGIISRRWPRCGT